MYLGYEVADEVLEKQQPVFAKYSALTAMLKSGTKRPLWFEVDEGNAIKFEVYCYKCCKKKGSWVKGT